MKLTAICITILLSLSIGWHNNLYAQKHPNILFAISDDQSFSHTSYAGSKFIHTPAFDRVAREGIYFSNCYAGSPGCAPSRSAIVTGRHHWQNEQSGQHASAWLKKYVPFIDLIEKNGYYTGRTGKGVTPFKYAQTESDSILRKTDAAGIARSNIKYPHPPGKHYPLGASPVNYFENFKYFMEHRKKGAPFFFWYGGHEPHRGYEKDSWKRMGKDPKNVCVPKFLPDSEVVRGDVLDYAIEIEWFDYHLQLMLEYLEQIGELENTIVIVTSDNGMPFPVAKGLSYEYGVHVPMAIRYPEKFGKNKVVETPVSFIDLAPTILEITNTTSERMQPIRGKSILNILTGNNKDSGKDRAVFFGRERHSSSRYMNLGYPQRGIREGDYIYVWNIKPNRWPAGAPQKFDPIDSIRLLPMYGLSEQKKYIRDAAYTDIDDGPTKTFIIENHKKPSIAPYFELAVDKRPEYELYNVIKDPYCLNNLSGIDSLKVIENKLRRKLMKELKESNDPRVVGPDYEIFDSYKRYSRIRKFPKPKSGN